MLCWIAREGLTQKRPLSLSEMVLLKSPKSEHDLLQLAGERTMMAEKMENSRKMQERQSK